MRGFAELSVEAWLLRMTARVSLAMLFAAILAFLAPFGTYRFGLVDRVGYWTIQMASWLILSQSAVWLTWHIPALRSRGTAQHRIAATAIATVPMMVVAGVANNMMNGWQPTPDELIELFLSIALIGGGCSYLSDLLVDRLQNAHASHAPAQQSSLAEPERVVDDVVPAEAGPSDTALIERLPAHIRADILCLQVEDHYVRVHSRSSSAMILMRFSDALRGIDHIPGAQVHRSWWVADDAVTSLRKTGRTAQLTLSNGTTVPVSQPYLAQAIRSWGSLEMSAA
jgi:hypothetical protein